MVKSVSGLNRRLGRRQSPPPAPLQQQQQPRGRRLPPPGSSARGGGERDAPPQPPRGRAGARRQEKTPPRLLPARSTSAPAPGRAARRLSPAPRLRAHPGPRPEPSTAASLSAPAAAWEPRSSRPARPPSSPRIPLRTGMGGRCGGSPQRPGPRGFSSFRPGVTNPWIPARRSCPQQVKFKERRLCPPLPPGKDPRCGIPGKTWKEPPTASSEA
ncbi:proline-rich proteoglycan 2-like [Lutra lutra]|uniref:proline-rich proteoglycan 2-like n=1 Tax=Lutra lutra TaxID=9657 RepID=UPI001FD4315C|nr:proline-rich proteoglycan 2-like [Lutra lutra]